MKEIDYQNLSLDQEEEEILYAFEEDEYRLADEVKEKIDRVKRIAKNSF